MSNFAYLHVHTRYSRSGGPTAPLDWCRRAAELGYSAISVTDSAPLAAMPSFYLATRKVGIAPLYGIELNILLPGETGRKTEPIPHPALLFARNAEGIQNLGQLASQAYAGWPAADKPLNWDTLAANKEGILLILLGGDEAGAFTPFVTATSKKLSDWGRVIKATFPGSAFVGLPHAGRPGDNALADQVVSSAALLGIPIAATPTARYLHPEDASSYEAFKAARSRAGWPHASTTSIAPCSPGHDYLRTPDEAAALFARWPEAVESVAHIVEMCTFATEEWPFTFNLSHNDNGRAYLGTLAEKHLSDDEQSDEVRERLQAELDTIQTQRSEGAWAALAAISDRTKQQDNPLPVGAPIGPARHSVLAYALSISPILPQPTLPAIRNPQSAIGIELPEPRREEVVAAVAAEFGPDRLARAACPLPITPAQAAQAAAIVLGISGDDLTGLVLAGIEKGWEAFSTSSPLQGNYTRIAALALTLKDVPLTFRPDPDTYVAAPRQTHLTTTLAAYGPLLSTKGCRWMPWSAEELGALNYPAFTLNTTHALSTLDAALSLAKRYPVPGFHAGDADPGALPTLSDAALEILRKGELAGIPYLVHTATKSWDAETSLDATAQVVARSLHPVRAPAPNPQSAAWDGIVAPTSGTLLFNDQLYDLLAALGVPTGQAHSIRSALLHPTTEESNTANARFIEAVALPEADAESLWTCLAVHTHLLVERSSAAAWGRIALWLVALKSAHPAAFLAGALTHARGRVDITALAEEARRLGIRLLPPNVNASGSDPTLERDGEGWGVLWGLNHLPGWQGPATAQFLAARSQAGFASLQEIALAAVDAGITLPQLETLIHAGACDTLGARNRDREAMLSVLPAMLEWAQATRRNAGQLDLFAAPLLVPPTEDDFLPAANSQSPRERHLRRLWEEAHIGAPFTDAPEIAALTAALEKSGGLRSRLITTAQIGQDQLDTSIYLVGVLSSIRLLESSIQAGKDPMALAYLEDTSGSIELVAFPPNYKRHADLWVESSIVIVTARVRQYEDGEIYLLSEHLAPFQVGTGEEAMTLTIKAPRQTKNASKPDNQPTTTSMPMPAVPIPARPSAQPVGASGTSQPYVRPLPPLPAPSGEPSNYSLIISIPPADDDHTVIDSMIGLNALLNAHPGPDTVTLRVQYSPETGKWTRAQLPAGVRYSHQLESAIRRLLGDDSLAVIKLLG